MNLYERRKREQFLDRVRRIFEVREEQAERLLSIEHGSSLRINRLTELSAEQIRAGLEQQGVRIRPISWCGDAYFLDSDKRVVSESTWFQQGYVYLQVASSLVAPLALDPQPGDSILDVCAAPGGKAAHIASLVGNQCELHLNDAIQPRAEKLRQITATCRVQVAGITQVPGQYLTKHFDRQFDRILLDAQCSGEGMLNLAHPNALRFWSLARIRKFSRLQEKMLSEAFQLLRPGGTMVYSTCTLAPEENEAPVDRLLRICPQARLEPIPVPLPQRLPGLRRWQETRFSPACQHALRVLPSEWTEHAFVCRIVKAG